LRLEDAYHRKDVQNWGALNWEFHKSLYLPSRRVQTLAILQGINTQTDRYIRLQLQLTGAVADAELEHRELLRLCAERNVKEAVSYMRRHILSAGRNLLVAIKQSRSANAA